MTVARFVRVGAVFCCEGGAVIGCRLPPASLILADAHGHSDEVRALLGAGALVDQTGTTKGITPLCIACLNGHGAVVSLLLAAGLCCRRVGTVYVSTKQLTGGIPTG